MRWRSSATARSEAVSCSIASTRARSSASRACPSRAVTKTLAPRTCVKKIHGKRIVAPVSSSACASTTRTVASRSRRPVTDERRSSRPNSHAVRLSRKMATKPSMIARRSWRSRSRQRAGRSSPVPRTGTSSRRGAGPPSGRREGHEPARSAAHPFRRRRGRAPSTTPASASRTAAVSTHQTRRNSVIRSTGETVASARPLVVIREDDCRSLTTDALRYIVIAP